MTTDSWRVKLETPASTRYLHIVRLTVAGAAAEAGLDTEEIEDVKIAVDELCSVAIAAVDDAATLSLELIAVDQGVRVEATLPVGTTIEIDELASAILDATVDDVDFDADALGGGFRVTKTHRDR